MPVIFVKIKSSPGAEIRELLLSPVAWARPRDSTLRWASAQQNAFMKHGVGFIPQVSPQKQDRIHHHRCEKGAKMHTRKTMDTPSTNSLLVTWWKCCNGVSALATTARFNQALALNALYHLFGFHHLKSRRWAVVKTPLSLPAKKTKPKQQWVIWANTHISGSM